MTGNLRLGFHAPSTVDEIADLVAEAAHAKIPLEVRGRGSKHEVGRYSSRARWSAPSVSLGIRSMSRPSSCWRRRRNPDRRDRQPSPSTASSLRSSRSISDRCSAPQPGKARSAASSPPIFPAAAAFGRRRARSSDRCRLRQWLGRALQIRRARDEERHRLRSLQGRGRLLGHARGDDRGCHEGAAGAAEMRTLLCLGLPDQTAVEVIPFASARPTRFRAPCIFTRRSRRSSRIPTSPGPMPQ